MRLARPAAIVLALAVTATLAYAHTMERSLYSRLGGRGAITAVVDDFVTNVAKDNRINKFFADTDIPRLKRLLVQQICAGSGGPCKYEGADMKAAHADMGIRKQEFHALVEDLQAATDARGIPFTQQNRLLALLAPMHRDIITER